KLFGLEKNSCEPSYEIWRQTIIPKDRKKIEEVVLNASKKGIEFTVEWRVNGTNGTVRWVMAKGVPFPGIGGQVCRYVGIVIDITDRMQVKEKQRQNEEFFRKLFEGHSATQLIIDPATGNIMDANQAAADYYGWSVDTLRKMDIQEINTLSPEEVMSEMGKSRSLEKKQFSFQHRKSDGSLRDVEVFSNKIEVEGKELLYSIVHDVTERKQSEKLLYESSERYRSLFNNMLNGIASCKMIFEDGRPVDFIYEEVNSRFEILTGLKNVEGRKVSEVISGIREINPELFEIYGRVAMTGEPEKFDFYVEPLKTWFEISAFSSKKGHFVALFDNVTERKSAEEALKQSEETFRKMFETHSAVMILLDPETGNIIDANQAAACFYGWPVNELRKMHILQITTATFDSVREAFEKIISSDQNRFLFSHRRADGSLCDVEVFSKNIVIEGRGLLYSIIHDVTKRKRLELLSAFRHHLLEIEESLSEEQILQAALDETKKLTGSGIGFYHFFNDDTFTQTLPHLPTNIQENICRVDGKWTHSPLLESGAWDEMIREKKTVIHNDYNSLPHQKRLPKGHPEIIRELITPVIKGEKIIAIIGVSNKPSDYDDDDAGYACSIANTAWDIITRKLSRQSEKRMQEELIQSQKMELVGQLAGGIAHDFNNMLTVILGHAEMALDKPGPSYEDLEAIQKAANHSAELTRQLLAFARKQTVIPKVLDLNAKVDGMLSMLRRLIGENITLTWIPKTKNAQVKLDPSQIDQILVNLCINARDAIDEYGNITIESSKIHVDEAKRAAGHPCAVSGFYITLSITDNGHGIDKKHLPHIFEPFFTTKDVGKGTGMGLSTVYGIVKQNSGYIEVQSEKSKGSSIKIYLPWHPHDAVSLDNNNLKPDMTYGKETILLVEDQSDILKLYKQILEQKGYVVLATDKPTDAIMLAEQRKGVIDLLVTDVIMPEMNGSDLFKKLQLMCGNLTVLFMSGYTSDIITHHHILNEGVNFIEKPFSINALTTTVQDILKTKVKSSP
ncbi:MAG: PAS domain S-box protein, partial [Chlorobiales bacterium]|nr:PAS domain S-box protein [Chlorobiales bacterium]